jgi:hypothetical protein
MTLPLIVETIVALAGVRVAIPFMFSFEIVAVLALNYLAARELEAAV